MRSIAFMNQKGGVGKTTTAVNVAAGLAVAGQRVLLIDADPQAHATLHLGAELVDGDGSVYDLLIHQAAFEDVARPVSEQLTLLPSHIDLVAADTELAGRAERETVLARAIERQSQRFDYCLFDCPPALNLLTVNALAAADEVIIPLQPHFLALQGLGKLLETVSLVRGVLKPELRVSGVVLCMYERTTRLAQEVLADVSQYVERAEFRDAWYGARVFEASIRRNIKLAECPSFGQTIFDYAPRSHGAEDYAALAREIHAMAEPSANPLESRLSVSAGDAPPAGLDGHPVPSAAGTVDSIAAHAAPQHPASPTAPPAARDTTVQPATTEANAGVPQSEASRP